MQTPGASSPYINSAVILLSNGTYEDAVASCEALSETLWSPEDALASIQTSLDYLVYQGKASQDTRFWVASLGNGTRAISTSGAAVAVRNDAILPALCTQSAPLASAAQTDASPAWQISVRSNHEDLVGLVSAPPKRRPSGRK